MFGKKKKLNLDTQIHAEYVDFLEYACFAAYQRGYYDRHEVGQPTWIPGREITPGLLEALVLDKDERGPNWNEKAFKLTLKFPRADKGTIMLLLMVIVIKPWKMLLVS